MKKIAAIIIFILIIILLFNKPENNLPFNKAVNINITSDVISLENEDTNIYLGDENNYAETFEILKSYGIEVYYGSSGIDISDYDIVIYDDVENKNFEMINDTLVINSLFYNDYPLVYSFSITDKINEVMVTPYINSSNDYIKLSDLSLDGDYKKQTEIISDIEKNITNLSYIPREEYQYISQVESIDELSVINKNSCMLNEETDFSTPDVLLSEYTTSEVHSISSDISDDVKLLFDDLSSKGIDVVFDSGYRSKSIQQSLYDSYALKDGVENADKYSARAGCSEHQTGYAFDLNTVENQFGELENLNDTQIAKDIQDVAYKYGFILRYPKNKTHITQYTYESWHFRYVGTKASKVIYENDITLEEYVCNKNFYDTIVKN